MKLLEFYRFRRKAKKHPDWLRNPVKVIELMTSPSQIHFYCTQYISLAQSLDTERTPYDVIKTGEGTPYEIVNVMAYLLHFTGWKTLIMSGALDINDLNRHPDEYFVVYNNLDGNYYIMDIRHEKAGRDFGKCLTKDMNYMASDWTGDRELFAIIPRNKVPWRLDEDFDPKEDMP